MKRCETCTNCSIYQGDEQPDNSSFIYCTKGHFEDYPESFFNDPVDYFRDCKDYSVDFQFTWRGPLIVHYRRTKDGGIEVSSLTDWKPGAMQTADEPAMSYFISHCPLQFERETGFVPLLGFQPLAQISKGFLFLKICLTYYYL